MYIAGTLTSNHIDRFKAILGERFVITDPELLTDYAHDETADFRFPPDVVLKPRDAAQVSQILKICNLDRIPVTPGGQERD